MAANNRQVIAVADAEALAQAAAERVVVRIVAGPERVAICLTGGSSPKRLYELLGTEPYRSRIPWDRVHWFIGDERFVPASSPFNNMTMARRIFLDACAPVANIHPIPTNTGNPDESALRYARDLQSFYGGEELKPERPLFDLVLMGVGPDGHTASLFPGYPAIDSTTKSWVTGVPKAHAEPFVSRVSLTLHTLGSCREMLFEVAGAEKRSILTRVFAGENLPASRAHSMGETVWLVDKAALPENFLGR